MRGKGRRHDLSEEAGRGGPQGADRYEGAKGTAHSEWPYQTCSLYPVTWRQLPYATADRIRSFQLLPPTFHRLGCP